MMLRHDYSWTEEALGFWASVTLSVLAVASLGLRYIMAPIACWTPAQFAGVHVFYTNEFCFKQRMITLSVSTFDFRYTQFTYHQWVPFALGMGALLCVLPHAIWRLTSAFLWLDTHRLARLLADNQLQKAAKRHVMMRDHALLVKAGLQGARWTLTAAAATRKILVTLVSIGQIFLAAYVFQPQLVPKKEYEQDFNTSVPLPELFFCEIPIKMLQNIQTFTVQCTLPITQVYNKGFAFLFYLFLLLSLCCVLDTALWVCRLLLPGLRDSTVRRYLAVGDPDLQQRHHWPLVARFLNSLGPDGHLLLALTADCCGSLAAADFTNHLWHVFKEGQEPIAPLVDHAHSPHGLVFGPAHSPHGLVLGPAHAPPGLGGPAPSPPVAAVVMAQPPPGDYRMAEAEAERGRGGGEANLDGAITTDLDDIPLVEMPSKA